MTGAVGQTGWLLPPGASRTPRLLPLGTLGGRAAPVVDDRGLVTPGGDTGNWSIDWWVAAEDRWHLPATEPGVRQALVDHSPVVETRLRIPGGDAVHRAYGFLAPDGAELLAIEVANDSAVPVAVALAVRPFGPRGADGPDRPGGGGVGRLHLSADERVVAIDGEAAVALPRKPAGATWSAGDGADIVGSVTDGTAPFLAPVPAGHADPTGRAATAALVFPLPHRQALRFVVAVPGSHLPTGATEAVPSVQQVANGWAAQSDRGARVELPDPLGTAAAVTRRRLLLWEADVVLAPALDSFGWHDEVEVVLAALALPDSTFDGDQSACDYLVALAAHVRLTANRDLLAASADSIAAAASALAPRRRTGRLGRRSRHAGRHDDAGPGGQAGASAQVGLEAAVELFGALGDGRAAADARRLADGLPPFDPSTPPVDLVDLDPVAAAPSTASLRRDAVDTASALRRLLVDDADPAAISLLPGWSDRWYGHAFEAHDLPTAAGELSFALRWHGTRPALLWELKGRDGAAPVIVRCPVLDRRWSSAERRGEALLGEVEPPPEAVPHPALVGDAAAAGAAQVATSAQPPVSVWSIGPPPESASPPPDGGPASAPDGGSFS